MSLTYAIGNVTGSTKAPSVEIHVWDTAFADVDPGTAVSFALSVAPATIFGNLPEDSPGVDQIAGHITKVTVNYSSPDLQPQSNPQAPESGSLTRSVNFQAQSKFVTHALEPIGVFDSSGDVTSDFSHTKWFIKAIFDGFDYAKAQGMTVDPLPETRTLTYHAPNAIITDAYLDDIESLCGKFNDATAFGKPQGSIQFVRFNASERTANDWDLSFGFGYKEPEFNREVDDITIPELRGSWIFWTRELTRYDDIANISYMAADSLFVQRVWEEGDFSLLDLPATVTYPPGEEA